MIQVDAATAVAIRQPKVGVTLRAVWNMKGTGALDISERVIEWPRTEMRLGAFLGGVRESEVVLVLANHDGYFTPDPTATGSVLANVPVEDWLTNRVTLDVGIVRPDDTIEYVPFFVGRIMDAAHRVGVVELSLLSIFSSAQQYEVSEEVVIDPRMSTGAFPEPATLAMQMFTRFGLLAVGDFDTTTFTRATYLHEAMGWWLHGSIRRGTRVGAAAEALARSGNGNLVPTEDGSIRWDSNWPARFGDEGVPQQHFAQVFDATNSGDWSYARPLDIACTEVVVGYQGASANWRVTAKEGVVGRVTKTVVAPYIAFLREAKLLARVLYEQHASFPAVLGWTTGPVGILAQINDRVAVCDPITGVHQTARIVTKSSTARTVRLEAVVDGHEDSVIRNTYAAWDSTTWDAAGEDFL